MPSAGALPLTWLPTRGPAANTPPTAPAPAAASPPIRGYNSVLSRTGWRTSLLFIATRLCQQWTTASELPFLTCLLFQASLLCFLVSAFCLGSLLCVAPCSSSSRQNEIVMSGCQYVHLLSRRRIVLKVSGLIAVAKIQAACNPVLYCLCIDFDPASAGSIGRSADQAQ